MNCPYNKMVLCESTKKCATCGWNPVVSERRIAMLQERLEAEKAEREQQEKTADEEM